jgi:hypothetical protein
MLSTNLKKVFYYVFLLTTLLLGLYAIYINTTELIERSLNHYTIFSQLSWLTNKEAILYCLGWAIVFTLFLIALLYYFQRNNKKAVIRCCLFTWITSLIVMFIDTLTYYEPV